MTKTLQHIAVAALCGLVLASVAYGAHRVAQSRTERPEASETPSVEASQGSTFHYTPSPQDPINQPQRDGWIQWWPVGEMPDSVRQGNGPFYTRPGEEGAWQTAVY